MYIFLDCDGVLNQLQPNYYLDKVCVEALGRIVRPHQAKVVLISTWRKGFLHDYDKCTPQIQALRAMCKECGFDIEGRTEKAASRSEEIQQYVTKHNIQNYVILDDDEALFTDKTHLYIVNALRGLTNKDVKGIGQFVRKLEKATKKA